MTTMLKPDARRRDPLRDGVAFASPETRSIWIGGICCRCGKPIQANPKTTNVVDYGRVVTGQFPWFHVTSGVEGCNPPQ